VAELNNEYRFPAYSINTLKFPHIWLVLSGSQTIMLLRITKWNEICAKYSFQIQVNT